jgi:hypothetical protein
MAKDDPTENRSEYIPPTSPPRARVPSKREFQSVKLDPTIDRRRQKTQISQRSKVRESRSYTVTAFIAGALGALAASGVYLAMTATGDADPKPPEPVRHGVTHAETTAAEQVRLAEPRVESHAASALPTLSAPATPVSPDSLPLATVESRPKTSGTSQRPTAHSPVPPLEVPSEPPTAEKTPNAPRVDPSPPPATSGSSRSWVGAPPRKVWVP